MLAAAVKVCVADKHHFLTRSHQHICVGEGVLALFQNDLNGVSPRWNRALRPGAPPAVELDRDSTVYHQPTFSCWRCLWG